MNYHIDNQMEKSFSMKKLLLIALAVPFAAAVFYVLLFAVVNIGEYLTQYLGVAGYIVAFGIVAMIANLVCRTIVRPIRRAFFPD